MICLQSKRTDEPPLNFDVILIHMILFQHAAIQRSLNIPVSLCVCSFSCQVRKKNVLKDFVTVAGPLGVTHFMIFSKTQSSINMVRPGVGKQNTVARFLQYEIPSNNGAFVFSETCPTSQRPHASFQGAQGKYSRLNKFRIKKVCVLT